MKTLKPLYVLFFAVMLLVAACSKTGPAGASGAPGPQGPAGPDSVLHAAWITLQMSFDSVQSSTGDSVFSQILPAGSITQQILDSGLVLTYLSYVDSTGSTQEVNAAPYFNPELFQVGSISLTSYIVNWSGASYRYIIVPGWLFVNNCVTIGGKTYTRQQLRTMDYQHAGSLFSLMEVRSNN